MTFSLKLTPLAAVGLYFTLANAQVNCSVSLAIIEYRTHINPSSGWKHRVPKWL
jgi:hypothetical protein